MSVSLLTALLASPVHGGADPVRVTEEFNNLATRGIDTALNTVGNLTPFTLGGVTFNTDTSLFVYSDFQESDPRLAPTIFSFGAAIGTTSDLGYWDVSFSLPVSMAGGWVGGSAGPVLFFDDGGALIATVTLSEVANEFGFTPSPQFAGWQVTEGQGIKRIRFVDAMSNEAILVLDRLTWEENAAAPVPEPTTILLLGSGLAGIGVRRWRLRLDD